MADLSSGVLSSAGPADRKSACASSADSPVRSVDAPPISCHPPQRPWVEYTGTPPHDERLEVTSSGTSGDFQFFCGLCRRDPALLLQQKEQSDQSVGSHGAAAGSGPVAGDTVGVGRGEELQYLAGIRVAPSLLLGVEHHVVNDDIKDTAAARVQGQRRNDVLVIAEQIVDRAHGAG